MPVAHPKDLETQSGCSVLPSAEHVSGKLDKKLSFGKIL